MFKINLFKNDKSAAIVFFQTSAKSNENYKMTRFTNFCGLSLHDTVIVSGINHLTIYILDLVWRMKLLNI